MADQALDGDPDAMRAFADRVVAPRTEEAVRSMPDGHACGSGSAGCDVFTTADTAATIAVTAFLVETEQTIGELRSAAHHAAEDYRCTDESGAMAIIAAIELPSGGRE